MNDLWKKKEIADLIDHYKSAKNRLILLDFDGTIIDLVPNPAEAIPSKDLTELLLKLAKKSNNKVVIITGRRKNDIDCRVGHLPIDIVAEHGALIKENCKWDTLLESDTQWKKEALPVFNGFTLQCPNSYLEEKRYSFAWHYRNTEGDAGIFYSRKLIETLKDIVDRYQLKIIDGKKIVEIISKKINKGKATSYFVDKYNFDYILSMGDDKTDEDMFEVLKNNQNAFTIKIGNGNSLARYSLQTVQEVNQVLVELL